LSCVKDSINLVRSCSIAVRLSPFLTFTCIKRVCIAGKVYFLKNYRRGIMPIAGSVAVIVLMCIRVVIL
jgi:hypothetical protein